MTTPRRRFLQQSLAFGLLASSKNAWSANSLEPSAYEAVESAHAELWRRFVRKETGVLLDYTGLDGSISLPTPEECALEKPNALAWWCPAENGAMFTGMYLASQTNRAMVTGEENDRDKAKQLAEGLYRLASVSEVPGFIARGIAEDGKGFHGFTSSDQSTPWFYGLWRYLKSDLPEAGDRQRLTDKVVEVARALQARQWQPPAGKPSLVADQTLNGREVLFTFMGFAWKNTPRLLFIHLALHDLTGDEQWRKDYLRLLHEKNPENGVSRLEVCEMAYEAEEHKDAPWTDQGTVAALRGLWDLETDDDIKNRFHQGLLKVANHNAEKAALYVEFQNDDDKMFDLNWRVMLEAWQPHTTISEARTIASAQSRLYREASPRWRYEHQHVGDPLFAAWNIAFCPDAEIRNTHKDLILSAIAHYRYDLIYSSRIFAAEAAWWELVHNGQ